MLARVDLDTPAPVKAIKKLLFALERLKQFTNDIIALNALKKLSSSLLKRDEEVAPLTEDDLKEIADFRDQIRGAYGWEVDDDEEQHSTSSRRKTAERKVVAESDRDEEVPGGFVLDLCVRQHLTGMCLSGPHSRGLRTRKSKALVQAEESDADSDSSEASTSSGSTSSSDASDSDDD